METAGRSFICSGSLLSGHRSIVTAAHCISGGDGTPTPVKTIACFHDGIDPGVIPGSSQLATSVSVASYFVNLGYTGGSIGLNLNPGRRRQGDNMFDYAIGDVALNGWLETAFGGTPAKSRIMLANFDNGTALQDSGCRIGISLAARIGFRDTGRGTMKAISPPATRAARAS